MSIIEIHHCPRCDLRFTNLSEIEDHLYRDHDVALAGGTTTDRDQPLGVAPTGGLIVVPLDPSRPAPKAAKVALAIARQGSMAVELVAAQPPGLDKITTETYLHRRVRDIADANVSVTCEDLGPRQPAEAILDYLDTGGASIVCMDTHTRGAVGELAFGSISHAVARRSPVPLLLCGPRSEPVKRYHRMVVGIDGSELAERALAQAISLSQTIGATIELFEVVDPDVVLPPDVCETAYLDRLAASCPVPIEKFDTVHARHPARALAEMGSEPGTIVAVGTQGRSGFRRLRVGSVAIETVRHARCPVLVVPPSIQIADRGRS